jgi:hypothetical protein
MDFEERLQRAIQRGKSRADEQLQEQMAKQLSEEESQKLHTQYRLELSEHIEQCVQRLANHFPGFRFETIFGDRGWGAACYRDDLRVVGGRRVNDYSRLEMTIRPFNKYHVLDLAAKGTIGNKEVFNRNHFEPLDKVDLHQYVEMIDHWILEYAELYAARA